MILEARSPFFRGMLESNMAEAVSGQLVVRDIVPEVMKAALHFIYTGEGGAWVAARRGVQQPMLQPMLGASQQGVYQSVSGLMRAGGWG